MLPNHLHNMFLQQEEKHPQAITSVVYCEITSIYLGYKVWKTLSKFLSQDIMEIIRGWWKSNWIKNVDVAGLSLSQRSVQPFSLV